MNRRWILGFFTIALGIVLSVRVADTLARREGDVLSQIDLLVDVRHEVVQGYVEEPDQKKMITEAVRAMVGSLNDPYTLYLPPDELDLFDKQVRGSFSGIGAEIDIHEGRLRIVSPLEDSPAWQSGVMAGDIVLEIDGQSTEGITLTDAVKRLTGPEGTEVTIKVRHPAGDEKTITITRAKINVQTVRGLRKGGDNHWNYILDPVNRIGYIRITQFSENTAEGVRKALDQLQAADARGLILDLRFNPGGLLESAVAVCDLFLDQGQRIVSIKGRAVPERVELATTAAGIGPIPIVVLANEASASAAEIVTGALADNGRAKFIGTRTFGKGSVQQVKMLEQGQGALKITNAYYYLPNGRNIHRREAAEVWGVDPEDGFYVPMTTEQMTRMVDVRRETQVIPDADAQGNPIVVTPEWLESNLADPQLAAGLRALLGFIETGQWPVVGRSGANEIALETRRENLIRQRDLLDERLEEIQAELAKLQATEQQGQQQEQQAGSQVQGQAAANGTGAAEPTASLATPDQPPAAEPPPATQPIESAPLEPVAP